MTKHLRAQHIRTHRRSSLAGPLRRGIWLILFSSFISQVSASQSLFSDLSDSDSLRLKVEKKHLKALEKTRKRWHATPSDEDRGRTSASLKLELEDRKAKGKLRVDFDKRASPRQQDRPDWAFRLELDNDTPLLGFRRMALEPLSGGADLRSVLIALHMQERDVLAPRVAVLPVILNDKSLGDMIVREGFSKELLESQRRREGILARFEIAEEDPGDEPAFFFAEIRAFRRDAVAGDEKLSRQLRVARGLLRGFLQRELPAREVFDLEVMGRFLAIVETWGAAELLDPQSLRFYFNPITQRIEPIAFGKGSGALPAKAIPVVPTSSWGSLLLSDAELRAAYLSALAAVTGDLQRNAIRSWIDQARAEKFTAEPDRAEIELGFDALIARAGAVGRQASEAGTSAAAAAFFEPAFDGPPLRVYRRHEEGRDELLIANVAPDPILIESIAYPSTATRLNPKPVQLAAGAQRRVPGRPPGGGEYAEHVAISGSLQGQPLQLDVRIVDQLPSPPANPIPTARLEEVLDRHPFLVWQPERARLQIRPGLWRVAGSLVLPPGVGLSIGKGTTLRFPEEGLLLATGPLVFLGTPQHPIILEGLETELGPRPWQGIAALESSRDHHWRHVVVRNTTGIDRNGWQLTGGVTLRKSRIHLEHSELSGNRGEDALNLIRSHFELDELTVTQTPSDALDADFCEGRIRGGRFEAIGGDGIDVSGSQIEVDGVALSHVRDKAISVGERSRLAARNVAIHDAGTAVASKDASLATLQSIRLSSIRHPALMAYVKKKEYGHAEIIADDITTSDVARLALPQLGSRIRIDGEDEPPQEFDVEALYRHGFMKK